MVADAVLTDPSDPERYANLIVNYRSDRDKFNETNYQVLETDYESFTIIYNCEEADDTNGINERNQNLTQYR